MKLSPTLTRLMLNGFPPLLFNGIRITHLQPDFLRLTVRIRSSLLNRNLQRTIFGGTIFSAADPYYAILYWQLMYRRGLPTEAWLKQAEIDYHRPGKTDLRLHFRLTGADARDAEQALRREGKFERWHEVEVRDRHGRVCATVRTLVHLRLRNLRRAPTPAATDAP
ncbi:MAG: YiiD C-terminal domain-containing protein [Catalinimonas sp.]